MLRKLMLTFVDSERRYLMPAKKKVDYKKLLKAVQSGKPQAEIIKQFKFNTATQFKNHYWCARHDVIL
jgi:hypothetical protein